METTNPARSSFLGLFRIITGDTRTFIRQEIQLAKTELSEKIAMLGRNAVTIAIGGFVAYAGLIVFLVGLGWLVAWALQQAGLQPMLASFIGIGAIGLLVIIVGCVLLLSAIKKISSESVAPQRTIDTIQELRTAVSPQTTMVRPSKPEPPKPQPSSAQLKAEVEATEGHLGATIEELGQRLKPSHINAQVKGKIRERPYSSSLVAVGAGLLSGLFIRRRFRRA